MVAPFDYADWKTGKSMVHEFQLQQPVWRALAVSRAYKAGRDSIDESWWSRTEQRFEWHFLKKNATSNLNTQYFLQAITVANSDPETLPRARGAYKEWADEHAPFDASYIYNPLGKTLISVEASSVDHYLLHAYDIAAMQHMVKLGFEIRHQRIAAGGIPAFMALHPEYSVDPVSRHAFSWSAENYELTLSPQASSGTNRRFSIPVWRGADGKPEMHR